jgi:hypothetical protein
MRRTPRIVCVPEATNGIPTACGYIRLVLPFTKIAAETGFHVEFVQLEDLHLCTADVIVVQRAPVRNDSHLSYLIQCRRQMNAILIVDLDDDLLGIDASHCEYEHYRLVRELIRECLNQADEVWTSTQVLANRYDGAARCVQLVENNLDSRTWSVDSRAPRMAEDVRFLYVAGATHIPDFEYLIEPAFRKLAVEFRDRVSLDVIGLEPNCGPWQHVKIPRRVARSYPAFATWLQRQGPYDIGLAPLRDTRFNSAKSNVKWLEYSAIGCATLGSFAEPYASSIKDGHSGLLVPPHFDAFYHAMRRVVIDPKLRGHLQMESKRLAKAHLEEYSKSDPRVSLLQHVLGLKKHRPSSPSMTVNE